MRGPRPRADRTAYGYESVASFAGIVRTDSADATVHAAGQSPKCPLKSDPAAGRIAIDSETTLTGIPPATWSYRLGNRSALDWVLDQHKERKPKDPTIRARFDTTASPTTRGASSNCWRAWRPSASRPRASSR